MTYSNISFVKEANCVQITALRAFFLVMPKINYVQNYACHNHIIPLSLLQVTAQAKLTVELP